MAARSGERWTEMAKIIYIGKDAPIKNILMDLLARVDAGEVVTLTAAVKLTDGCVATAYHADFGERAELIGHMQADLAWSMVVANIEKL